MTIRTTYSKGKTLFHIVDGDNVIALFYSLSDAAIVLRYMNGGDMGENERETALEIMKTVDDRK